MDPPSFLGPIGYQKAFLNASPLDADTTTDTANRLKTVKMHRLVMDDGEDMPMNF
jgi:hypothetical protein